MSHAGVYYEGMDEGGDMTEHENHDARKGYALRCECGYEARSKRDLQEHVDAMADIAAARD